MLFIYYFSKPVAWILPWIIQAFIYYRLLRKLGLNGLWALVPFAAEGHFSRIFFKNRRYYFHSLILTAIFLGGGFYLRWSRAGTMAGLTAFLFIVLAAIIYGLFLIILFWKIAKYFGKGVFYRILTVLFPFVFLFLLTFKNPKFLGGPTYWIHRFIKRWMRFIYNVGREVVFVGEAVGILAGVLFLSIQMYMPRPLVQIIMYEQQSKVNNVNGNGQIIDREASMQEDYARLKSDYAPSREKFFPSHSKDKDIVVLEYIIGSNLEDGMAMATFNIDQMLDATKNGSSLKFVIEAGGSRRWFTKGIKDESVGRYEIADGQITKVLDIPSDTSMSEPDELYDFLSWAKANYDADRFMLVFWDHGGGLSTGYGQDSLNVRNGNKAGTIDVNEIADVLKKADMKFDLIGFDACLMQGVELAKVLEPYADYYLASEETESGFGWYYTSAFKLLARDPSIATEVFAKEMISAFDVYNTVLNDGKDRTESTLSLIDLSYINKAYDSLSDLYEKQDAAIRKDSADYADISVAASQSYVFTGDEQIDLIDYLQKLDAADYDDSIATSQEIQEIINQFKASIVYRNSVSNEGINGIAVTFPYGSLSTYGLEHKQYAATNMDKAMKLYDDYFSIMAYQKKVETEAKKDESPWGELFVKDYTNEEWYVKGFEDYAEVPAFIDIPLIEAEFGYKLNLPETVWKIIIDSKEVYYQKCEEGWRYLGNDTPGAYDEEGHPVVSTDGTRIHINNVLAPYEVGNTVESEKGTIYKGTVKALMDGKTNIILDIEWDPIDENTGVDISGHVTGYTLADNENAHMEKGTLELKPGQSLQFIFDYYDEQGNLIKSEPYGKTVRVTSMDALKVEDKPLEECDLKYGIVLTDVYQRTFATELIETHISGNQ